MSCNTMIQWHCVAMASCQTKDTHNPDGLQQFGAQVTFICCSLMQSHNTFDSFGSLPIFQIVLRTASVHVAHNLQTYTLCVRNELTCSLDCLSLHCFCRLQLSCMSSQHHRPGSHRCPNSWQLVNLLSNQHCITTSNVLTHLTGMVAVYSPDRHLLHHFESNSNA